MKNIIETKKLTDSQILKYYYKYISNKLNVIYIKFKNYSNFNDIKYYTCNIIFNIFWVVFNSTNNIFMTIFILDKSFLLFTEFIILSKDPDITKDLYYKPNIIDAINFSYKKTINNIEISTIKFSYSKELFNTTIIIKDLIYINNKISSLIEQLININYLLNDDVFLKIYDKIIIFLKNDEPKEIISILDKIKFKKYNII